MTGRHLHQTIATPGGYEFLMELEANPATALAEEEILSRMFQVGVEDPPSTFNDFVAANLLQRLGERVGLSPFGIKTLLLLQAVNGGDLRAIYRRLSTYDSSLQMYELVREGMTGEFLENISNRPGFSRLYFCSPWIRLDQRQESMLLHSVLQAEGRGRAPELLVLTRPAEEDAGRAPEAVRPFKALGATVFLNRRLHTKLYIREPDRGGGYCMAIIGSQNLTRSQYLELGIRINADSVMINQLIGYFWELCNASVEV